MFIENYMEKILKIMIFFKILVLNKLLNKILFHSLFLNLIIVETLIIFKNIHLIRYGLKMNFKIIKIKSIQTIKMTMNKIL